MRGRSSARAAAAAVAAAIVASLLQATPAGADATAADLQSAEAAARHAVRAIFGVGADVQLSALVLSLALSGGSVVSAVPEPSSRTAGPVRFVLYGDRDGRRRIGRLTARVDVRTAHVRARGHVAARVVPAPEAVETVVDDIGRQLLAPLPTLAAVTAATTRKALAPGEVVTQTALVLAPLVTSGQDVMTVARVGALEVRGRAVAAQSGQLGETVIVVNPDTRKRLRARIVGDALVEVLLGS